MTCISGCHRRSRAGDQLSVLLVVEIARVSLPEEIPCSGPSSSGVRPTPDTSCRPLPTQSRLTAKRSITLTYSYRSAPISEGSSKLTNAQFLP